MRWTYIIVFCLAATPIFVSTLFGGCEETLEVCPPCGKIEDGKSEIVGEYRIDTTFTAVQDLKRWSRDVRIRTDAAVVALSDVFGATPVDDETAMEALSRTVQAFVSSGEISAYGGAVQYGRCAANRDAAAETQNRCEDLTCNIDRPNLRGLCRGDTGGTCAAPEAGVCFTPIEGDPCDGLCSGICNTPMGTTCPGTCLGVCDGFCLSYNEDGRCQGVCDGICVGTCETDLSVSCEGECTGECGVPSQSECGERDSFYGACNDISESGICTGHFYPEGCGAQCGGCGDAALDCREVSKFVAWTKLYCEPSVVSVNAATPTFDSLSADSLRKLTALERLLTPIAGDYAALSLLLEGYDNRTDRDLTDAFSPGEGTVLDEAASQYFDYRNMAPEAFPPVDLSRGYLPVEALKARIYWLQRTAINSDGGFRITAGTFDCLSPALNAAADIMDRLVPVTRIDEDDSVRYIADLDCNDVSSDDDMSDVPCLYDLMNTQESLLSLLDLTPDPEIVQ